jgi:hypothetical protein
MAYLDAFLLLDDAATLRVTGASSNYIDSLAAGWGADDELYAKFQVDESFAGTVGATIKFAIQIATDTAFATVKTVVTSDSFTHAQLTAGKTMWAVKLPADMMTNGYRYIRAYNTCALPGSITAGKITCALVKDVDITMDKVL